MSGFGIAHSPARRPTWGASRRSRREVRLWVGGGALALLLQFEAGSLIYLWLYVWEVLVVALKLTAMGTSTGAVIPKEMLARLKVSKGDTLFAVETPSGYLLTPYDPTVEEQLSLGREFMADYRETFRTLAK